MYFYEYFQTNVLINFSIPLRRAEAITWENFVRANSSFWILKYFKTKSDLCLEVRFSKGNKIFKTKQNFYFEARVFRIWFLLWKRDFLKQKKIFTFKTRLFYKEHFKFETRFLNLKLIFWIIHSGLFLTLSLPVPCWAGNKTDL